MPTPPSWFVQSLAIMDPLLRVRWGSAPAQWIIDRKAVIPPHELYYLRRKDEKAWRDCQPQNIPVDSHPNLIHKRRTRWQSVHEELISAEDGRRVIFTTPIINQQTYDWVCQSDIKRYGGYARFADRLEAEEDRLEEDRLRQMGNKQTAMNSEVYDMMDFLRRKKGTYLDENIQDMKYLLHGRKTKPGDAPLIALTDF